MGTYGETPTMPDPAEKSSFLAQFDLSPVGRAVAAEVAKSVIQGAWSVALAAERAGMADDSLLVVNAGIAYALSSGGHTWPQKPNARD